MAVAATESDTKNIRWGLSLRLPGNNYNKQAICPGPHVIAPMVVYGKQKSKSDIFFQISNLEIQVSKNEKPCKSMNHFFTGFDQCPGMDSNHHILANAAT